MGATGATTTHRHDLGKLDELARLPNGIETDERVLALVEQVAGLPHGLDVLVARYGTAPNRLVPRAVSFVLAQVGSTPLGQTWALTREFARRARGIEDPSTLINVLTAIQRHVSVAPGALAASPEPELAEFILHCLAQPPLVHAPAFDLLVGMAADGVPRPFFPRSSATQLGRIVKELGGAGVAAERDVREVLAALDRDG